MPDLTADELRAIDIACMHLLEAARRGRKKQQDYISIDNDSVGAEWMAAAVRSADESRVTLRALVAKHKEKDDA